MTFLCGAFCSRNRNEMGARRSLHQLGDLIDYEKTLLIFLLRCWAVHTAFILGNAIFDQVNCSECLIDFRASAKDFMPAMVASELMNKKARIHLRARRDCGAMDPLDRYPQRVR